MGKALKKLDPADTDVLTGEKAGKAELLDSPLANYGEIVFGTHGYFGSDIPGIQEPILALSMVGRPKGEPKGQLKGRDGFLRMSEVMGLKLNRDVVALTACQTGLGTNLAGEGVMSMGRAFQYAGSRSILMSLWSVSERSSVQLVESFFQHLKGGMTKLQALNAARQDIRKAGYQHPFYWAPFILVGEVAEGAEHPSPSGLRPTAVAPDKTPAVSSGTEQKPAPKPPTEAKQPEKPTIVLMQPVKAPIDVKLSVVNPKEVYRTGDELAFVVTVDRDCFVYLIDVGTEGTPEVLFPNKRQQSAKVLAGEQYRIPPAGGPLTLRVSGKPGADEVVAIASITPIDSIPVLQPAHSPDPKESAAPVISIPAIEEQLRKQGRTDWVKTGVTLNVVE